MIGTIQRWIDTMNYSKASSHWETIRDINLKMNDIVSLRISAGLIVSSLETRHRSIARHSIDHSRLARRTLVLLLDYHKSLITIDQQFLALQMWSRERNGVSVTSARRMIIMCLCLVTAHLVRHGEFVRFIRGKVTIEGRLLCLALVSSKSFSFIWQSTISLSSTTIEVNAHHILTYERAFGVVAWSTKRH